MKPQGRKQTKTRVAGHQNCGVCHPDTKSGNTRERRNPVKFKDCCLRCGAGSGPFIDGICAYCRIKDAP